MANITQKINYFPTPPNSSQSPQDFNAKANAFVYHQAHDYVDEVNKWAGQANLLKDEINGIVAVIPTGTINDTVTATDKVWSSTKSNAFYVPKSSAVFSNMPKIGADDIVSSGSNGNGRWIKYADGTLIQDNPLKSGQANGSRYQTITYPVAFKDRPTIYINRASLGVSDLKATHPDLYAGMAADISSNTFKASLAWTIEGGSTGYSTALIMWLAIGRWK